MDKHWRFEAESLRDGLKAFNRLLPSKSADVDSRAITVDRLESGQVRFRSKCGSAMIQRVLFPSNSKAVLAKEYTIDFHVLWSLLSVSMDDVVFIKRGKELYFETMGGSVELEPIMKPDDIDNELFTGVPEAHHSFEWAKFDRMLRDASKAMSMAFRVQDKRVSFNDGRLTGNFMFMMYRQRVPSITKSDRPIGFRAVDVVPVRLLMNDESLSVDCHLGRNVTCFHQGWNRVIIWNPRIDDLTSVDEIMDKHPAESTFTVDPDKLSRMLKAFKNIVGTTGPIRLEGDCSNVTIEAVNVSGKPVRFKLAGYDGLGFRSLVSSSTFISSMGLLRKDADTEMEVRRDRSILIRTGTVELLHASGSFYDSSGPDS